MNLARQGAKKKTRLIDFDSFALTGKLQLLVSRLFMHSSKTMIQGCSQFKGPDSRAVLDWDVTPHMSFLEPWCYCYFL